LAAIVNEDVFDLIDGLDLVDPKELSDFERAMITEVIPEITRVVEERQAAAAESRHWFL
jgi:hypothetical protein